MVRVAEVELESGRVGENAGWSRVDELEPGSFLSLGE